MWSVNIGLTNGKEGAGAAKRINIGVEVSLVRNRYRVFLPVDSFERMVDPDFPTAANLGSNYPRPAAAAPKIFRASPAFLWHSTLPIAAIVFPALMLTLILGSKVGASDVLEILLQCVLTTAGVLILTAVCNLIWHIRTSPKGLRSYNGMGSYSEIEWPVLEFKGVLNLLGLKYLRFKRKGLLFTILVPVDLANQDDFLAELRTYLGPVHSITMAVERQWGRAAD